MLNFEIDDVGSELVCSLQLGLDFLTFSFNNQVSRLLGFGEPLSGFLGFFKDRVDDLLS